MKRIQLWYFVCLFCIAAVVGCPSKREVKTEQKRYLPYGKDYLSWKKLSERPVVGSHRTISQIFVNPTAYPVSAGEKDLPYPEGSTFVVIHFDDEGTQLPYVYVMRKMPPSYDPYHNSWRYTVVDPKDWSIKRDGRLKDCIDCHQQYRARDFVPLMVKDIASGD